MISVPEELDSINDFIRWGASRFTEAQLYFGHGTTTALDEAAALVLAALHLDYELPPSYYKSCLTQVEKENICQWFARRIGDKIPAAYITQQAYFAGLSFYVDERVLVPRSPIAELINDHFDPWINPDKVRHILDLCTGSGCIAIACAQAFPEAQVTATDLSTEALAVAKINQTRHQLRQRLQLIESDLFAALAPQKYDLIVSNPPYVSLDEWQTLPAEYHAEPEIGFTAGESGLDIVNTILLRASEFLSDQGILVVEVGSSAQTLQDTYPQVPFYWLQFEHGGDGVFLLTAEQLAAFKPIFAAAC